MSNFSIETSFTQADLTRLHDTGTNIVVAKPTENEEPHVAWIVYRPLPQNKLSWEEAYGIYASNRDISNGTELVQTAATPFPALTGQLYVFNDSGFFGQPVSGGRENIYTACNEFDNLPKGHMTMGLYQNATVDSTDITGSAVSAAPVLFPSCAEMIPSTTVYLWTQSQVRSNTVVTLVSSAMTEVRLDAENPDARLRYEPQSGTFVPADEPTQALFDRSERPVLMPTGIVCAST